MADFFEDDDVAEVAQSNAEQLRGLEDREAAKILRAYKRVRQDLRDRLDIVDKGTFTEQKLRATLYQVQLGIEEMSKNLLEDMGNAAQSAAELGIDDLLKELKRWNKKFTGAFIPINIDAVRAATDTRNFLFNRYEVSLQTYSQTVRARIANGLTESVIAQNTMSEALGMIGKTFLGEEWKLQQIVRTELHNVYNVGKIDGMRELWGEGKGDIPDLMKTLFHPMDNRTGRDSIKLNANNPIVPIDEPFVETSTGKKLTYMAPPNRPNDRAILIPYRDGWKSR